jgi:hypothetical protein
MKLMVCNKVDNIIVDISTTKLQLFLESTSLPTSLFSQKGDEPAKKGVVQD